MADWDVSLVTDMLSLFNGKSQFNADISRWDVSSVTNMQSMFYGANAFNADISYMVGRQLGHEHEVHDVL